MYHLYSTSLYEYIVTSLHRFTSLEPLVHHNPILHSTFLKVWSLRTVHTLKLGRSNFNRSHHCSYAALFPFQVAILNSCGITVQHSWFNSKEVMLPGSYPRRIRLTIRWFTSFFILIHILTNSHLG